ncbi:unnamed protein product, partial [Prorocentrum cordatum]
ALQGHCGANIAGKKCGFMALQDQMRYFRLRPTCCNKKKQDNMIKFKLQSTLSPQLQTPQIKWGETNGGPPEGGLECGAGELLDKLGVQQGRGEEFGEGGK